MEICQNDHLSAMQKIEKQIKAEKKLLKETM
jgi:hypothetical protein